MLHPTSLLNGKNVCGIRKEKQLNEKQSHYRTPASLSVSPSEGDEFSPFVEIGPVNFLGRISPVKATRQMFTLTSQQCLWTLGRLKIKKRERNSLNLKRSTR